LRLTAGAVWANISDSLNVIVQGDATKHSRISALLAGALRNLAVDF
jgi:hypothetical protein